MSGQTLSQHGFDASALRREAQRNTMIEDHPQVSVRRAPPQRLQGQLAVTSPLSDNFPTPRANTTYQPIEPAVSPSSADTQSDDESLWSNRSHGSPNSGFDELYDVSESEVDDLPIKLSSSVKRRIKAPTKHARFPSIVIPSPSQWPTIQKLKALSTPLSPPTTIPLSPEMLSKLQVQSLNPPASSGAPSLDGSLTSEELAASSCPSTPDIPQAEDDQWEPPVQLDPLAEFVLQQLNPDEEQAQQRETVIEVPEEAVSEMKQIVESPPITGRLPLALDTATFKASNEPQSSSAEDDLAQLSIPSPGGFFASLDSSVRLTWFDTAPAPTTGVATQFYGVPFRAGTPESLPPVPTLPTGTATSFYGVPWRERPENPVEQTISVPSPVDEDIEEDPITARKIVFSPKDTPPQTEEIEVGYVNALQESANANIGRTQMWLQAQTSYMKAICEDDDVAESFKDIADAVPKTPTDTTAEAITDSSPGKKSVRFADADDTSLESFKEEPSKRISPIHDGTFWQGWRHVKRSQRARDVFVHRQARAEAEHVRRTSCGSSHIQQLQGRYEFQVANRPAPSRPVSSFLPPTTDDEKKEVIARVEKERQALEQMQSSSWALSAQKEVNGGRLLTSPIVSSFRIRHDVHILDLAGQVHCSWAWTVAAEHPDASVYTTVSSDAEAHVAESSLHGPMNHFVVAAPRQWELPFADDMFDAISARNLYSYLKTTWPRGMAADEWDLTLRECFRVLKPGGYFEFELLDAELAHPDQAAQAIGVEFAFNLKTRGYDPCAGKSFLPRLKRAGFGDIKRAWMVLPVADVLPKWTDLGKGLSTGATITPGGIGSGKCENYWAPDAAARVISPEGNVEYHEPPATGSTRDVKAMTGLVGARMWEQWMLKLSGEMGRSEETCLQGVAKALEEGGKGRAGWRCLVGWARKPL